MNKVNLVVIGKVKEKYFEDGIMEYAKRLSRFCDFKIIELKECNFSDKPTDSEIQKILQIEGEEILKKLRGSVYVLCIEGKQKSSQDFAKIISDELSQGNEITFVIGGSYGICDQVKNLAKGKISFSKMTFPHTLFRLMLTEQIYRAFMINANSAYHK